MAGLALSNQGSFKVKWPLAIAAVWFIGVVSVQLPTPAEADVFQQAINYVFTGKVDPRDGPEIVDRNSCVIVLRDPKFNRYIRYHLSRFKMDDALFDKKYSGSRVAYELSVKGDDVLVEYLDPDKKTVILGYRSAQIPLPGEIEPTQKALRIIFSDHCKPEKPKVPF